MDIGLPQKTIVVTPLHEPVPQWQPEREPISVPQEEPVLIPEKVDQ
jgi:hypothetical protein